MSDRQNKLETNEEALRLLGRVLKDVLPAGHGFILFLASHGPDGYMSYLSSVERESAISCLKEWLMRVEATTGFDRPLGSKSAAELDQEEREQ